MPQHNELFKVIALARGVAGKVVENMFPSDLVGNRVTHASISAIVNGPPRDKQTLMIEPASILSQLYNIEIIVSIFSVLPF